LVLLKSEKRGESYEESGRERRVGQLKILTMLPYGIVIPPAVSTRPFCPELTPSMRAVVYV
jgi:hypothetical protein